MSKPLIRRALLSALFLLPLAALPGRSAAFPPGPVFPNVLDAWSGGWFSVSGESGVASLNVSAQQNRRFAGAFVLWPPSPVVPPNPCFILGTASNSGEISLDGRNEMFMLRAHGQLNAGVMELDYILDFADGSMDMGTTSIGLVTDVPPT